MSNSYYDPHLRNIWYSAFPILIPGSSFLLSFERPEFFFILLMFSFLGSFSVYKTIFSEKKHAYKFVTFLLLSLGSGLLFHFSQNYAALVLLPFLPLAWGLICYQEIHDSLTEKEKEQ